MHGHKKQKIDWSKKRRNGRSNWSDTVDPFERKSKKTMKKWNSIDDDDSDGYDVDDAPEDSYEEVE